MYLGGFEVFQTKFKVDFACFAYLESFGYLDHLQYYRGLLFYTKEKQS